MTLRYIFHSGFLVETARCILVFDYWMDPADVMSGYMNTCKHVYVFSSHFHEDHFTKAILRWKIWACRLRIIVDYVTESKVQR